MAVEKVYVVDDELVFPGDPAHEILDAMNGTSRSFQRKLLTLLNRVISGEFDILQTQDWRDDQRREFVALLPETKA